MRKNVLILLFGAFFITTLGSLHAVGEKTIILGGAAAWNAVESRQGVVEITSVRPYPVLGLSSEQNGQVEEAAAGFSPLPPRNAPALDLALSFDEGRADQFRDSAGHYGVATSPAVSAMGPRWARLGSGAAYFSSMYPPNSPGNGEAVPFPLTLNPITPDALFAGGQSFKDFSVEFWLYPLTMENGEQILTWTSIRQTLDNKRVNARIQCAASRNRLQWTFSDFFSAPGDRNRLSLSFSGLTPITPRTWSHHLIRFDSATGLLEYLVNGSVESVRYTTPSGREGGEVYTPLTGEGSPLILGGRYMGLMDEFRIHSRFVENPQLRKYPNQGGRVETRSIDLGEGQSRILRVDALGGRVSLGGQGASRNGGRIANEYGGAGRYRFADDSALQFFIRIGNSPYIWNDRDWRPFEPGTELPGVFQGRYVQLAAVFYPSGDGETTPYLEELRLIYQPDEPPPPPVLVIAVARDGGVDLSWRGSPAPDTAGYLIYYGTSRGEYFGAGAAQGASPVDVGNRTSVHIGGLRNGVLYYFAVATYNRINPYHSGEFSREVSARPLQAFVE